MVSVSRLIGRCQEQQMYSAVSGLAMKTNYATLIKHGARENELLRVLYFGGKIVLVWQADVIVRPRSAVPGQLFVVMSIGFWVLKFKLPQVIYSAFLFRELCLWN